MLRSIHFTMRWRYLVFVLAFAAIMGLAVTGASAGRLSDTTTGLAASNSGSSGLPGGAAILSSRRDSRASLQPQGDAYMTLDPGTTSFGNYSEPGAGCPSGPPCNPADSDTVNTGDRFVLDLNIHGNSSSNLTAAQAYFTYDAGLAQIAEVDRIATACVLTQTVKDDLSAFET